MIYTRDGVVTLSSGSPGVRLDRLYISRLTIPAYPAGSPGKNGSLLMQTYTSLVYTNHYIELDQKYVPKASCADISLEARLNE